MVTLDTIYSGNSYKGLSTDTKPLAENGSTFFEMDTNKTYMYDKENSTWREISESSSGGGSDSGFGGSGGGGLVVLSEIDYKLTYNGNGLNRNQFEDLYNNNAILFFRVKLGDSDFLFGYVNSYDTEEYNISIIANAYNIAVNGSEFVRRIYYYNSTDDCWYSD